MVKRAGDEIAGEHALRQGERDRLGFEEIASRIANSMVDRASKDGLVIGLDGQWGSGKSSLLHLIERSLEKLAPGNRPTVINFRPWLVGNREALLTSLLGELADKIASVNLVQGDATQVTVQRAKKAAEAVRKFGNALGKTGEFLEAIGDFVPAAGFFGKMFKSTKTLTEKDDATTDLAALKSQVVENLKDLDHRFIITVDDVDRLEPAEVIEVLRLVRSVADFPNIVYLLCYDADRLAEAIKSAAKVEDGAAFLEKIVQLTVMVPRPEPFELREWFAEDLSAIIGTVSDDARERLKTVIDQEGSRLFHTPRSVVRALDSVRFFWPAVRDELVDPADLVWLQIIKDGSPKLYRWIEEYVGSVSATSFGTTMVSENGKAERLKALLNAFNDGHLADLTYRQLLSELLPGVAASFGDDEPPMQIYQKVEAVNRAAAIKGRRLASPDHYRLYFSLIGPTHAVTQASFDEFWQAADTGPNEAAAFLLKLHGQYALGTLRKSDVLLERLRVMDAGLWSPLRAKNLLLAFGQMMDEAYGQDSEERAFAVTTWDRSERLLHALYRCLGADERASVNSTLFAEGKAIGWLTAILRHETFSHGIYGDRKKAPEEWVQSEVEFEQACQLMIMRYQAMSMSEILAAPSPVQILYAWSQAGDVEGPRALIAESTVTDAGLVEVLSAFTSAITSSDRGRYIVLKKESVDPFADFDATLKRVTAIADSGPAELRGEAQRLVAAAKDASFW